jgi:hypothetical protein
MTERGLPIADGAPACPFVAFEDDRDERASSPDHRHRCYAEPEPAPRALAHQEAYCLSSAFPVCPTFQDWARREAARARGERARASESDAAAIAAAGSAQRNPPRNWSAPPPWAPRGGAGGPGSGGLWDEEDDGETDEGDPRDAVPHRGRGLSGSYADRVAGVPGAPMPGGFEDDPEPAPAAAPPAAPPASAPVAGAHASHQRRESWHGPEGSDDADVRAAASTQPGSRHRERDPSRVAAFAGDEEPQPPRPERRVDRRRDSNAPEWERARPMEAYPTLRARRLPELSIPPILVAVIAVALAAAVLFALPGLLGFGRPAAPGSTPTPSTQASAAASVAPTVAPPATPQVYTVQSGDTMSRIATRFEIPLDVLIAANRETIPNPDLLAIGDQVIIPVPVASELPAASVVPAAP